MTPADLKSLPDRELDAEIARALGWTEIKITQWYVTGEAPQHSGDRCAIPRYSTDLNAIHEAEGALTRIQRLDYLGTLAELICSEGRKQWPITHATAHQRAEALLLTLRGAQ